MFLPPNSFSDPAPTSAPGTSPTSSAPIPTPPTPTTPPDFDAFELRVRSETRHLTQTITSDSVIYVTHVTLGGPAQPSVSPAPVAPTGLSNAEIGGIIGGIIGGLLVIGLICCWALHVGRNYRQYGYTTDTDTDSGPSSSSSYDDSDDGRAPGMSESGISVPATPRPTLRQPNVITYSTWNEPQTSGA